MLRRPSLNRPLDAVSRLLGGLGLALFCCLPAACGEDIPPPDQVAAAFMKGVLTMDPQAMADEACPELAGEILDSREALAVAADSGVEMDLSGLTLTVVSETEEEAVVRMTGTAAWAGSEEQVDEELHLVKLDGRWKLCEPFR
jgi:hypothetical protein